ncbi:cell division transport system permease protein [Pontibacter ummariensis]|uniref:Cell division protein FtsX n=1 Tax=Pontibacter ummariensis TaxID=1610492 RepID=A0A239FBQ9_9BACT|nr:permease-like cell division protein FtsX [Pontibacter ummariensis]PRY12327.1 cell division transport system permease protein [Pontibacter ummariensis]SNS54356.1 cell division transport system permease protein [Pontibacter ummariensis]
MAAKIKHVKKKKLGNYPHAMVVFSISLALFVIGLFGLLLIHAGKLSEKVKESIEMQVYLDRNLTEVQLARLQKTFAAKEYIAYQNDTAQVRFISKEEGAKAFLDETGEDFMAFLGENPLRDAYTLRINANNSSSPELKSIKLDLEEVEGVYEVQYVESLIESINSNIQKISLVLLAFAAILLVVVTILINNTIKLALYSQRFLIRSMQLVGATSFFIQRPFLSRAIWQGIMSGIIASGLLFALMHYAYLEVAELQLLRDEEQTYLLMGALVVIGLIIGFISSLRAVRKYLRLSLDELY